MSNIKDRWEYFGENDPYFAVVSLDKNRKDNLTEATKSEFFLSGSEHVSMIWKTIEQHFVADFKPKRSFDFGCGVGRIVIPLALKSKRVTGVDISENMLFEAKRNCVLHDIENADFLQVDEYLYSDDLEYDFIHSLVVFQHMNPKLGMKVLRKMLNSLENGGIGALHFTYADTTSVPRKLLFKMYREFPVLYRIRLMLARRPREPLIPMYIYDLNAILLELQVNECHHCIVRFSQHGLHGVLFIFQKSEIRSI